MPMVYRKQWLDYWNAGYNVAMTLKTLGLESCNYGGRQSSFQICEDIGDPEKLKRQVKNFLRRRRALENKWLHTAILEAATTWSDVVGPCSLVIYGEVRDGCLSDDEFNESLKISWKNGGFVNSP